MTEKFRKWMISNRDRFLVDFENPRGKLKQDEISFHLRFHDDYSFKIVLEDWCECGYWVSKITQRFFWGYPESLMNCMTEIKWLEGSFQEWTERILLQTIHRWGSSDSETHETKEGWIKFFRKLGTKREGTRQFQIFSFFFFPFSSIQCPWGFSRQT